MAVVQQAGRLCPLPEWLRMPVPVEEFGWWLRFAGQSEGLDKPGLYLLGGVTDAYSWEQGIAGSWDQSQRFMQDGRNFAGVASWGEIVVKDLQAAVQSWDGVAWWLERRPETTAVIWLDWIAQRKEYLASVRMQFCRECAGWFEQWQYALPPWLQAALGLVPGVVESVSWAAEIQTQPL